MISKSDLINYRCKKVYERIRNIDYNITKELKKAIRNNDRVVKIEYKDPDSYYFLRNVLPELEKSGHKFKIETEKNESGEIILVKLEIFISLNP